MTIINIVRQSVKKKPGDNVFKPSLGLDIEEHNILTSSWLSEEEGARSSRNSELKSDERKNMQPWNRPTGVLQSPPPAQPQKSFLVPDSLSNPL